jgi:alpha-beta hydrolase superfamily lysophospholipase
MKIKLVFCLMLLCLGCVFSPAALAQSGTAVEVMAADGLVLKGDFYLVGTDHATVLLLHQMYTTRASWQNYIGTLTGAGYNVLAVDVRGYGQTRGKLNWEAAVSDVSVWMGWLRGSAGVRDAISTMGSSIGSSLAIVGCANDSACRTAIAISPGWNYNGIMLEAPLTNNFAGRQILVVYGHRDRFPALGIPRMVEVAPDVVVTQQYTGNAHGMNLLAKYPESTQVILDWLAGHSG